MTPKVMDEAMNVRKTELLPKAPYVDRREDQDKRYALIS
jgi:hypothetical protein